MSPCKSHVSSIVFGFLGAGVFWSLSQGRTAVAQVQGVWPAFVRLNGVTGVSPQEGHSKISGRSQAGEFYASNEGATSRFLGPIEASAGTTNSPAAFFSAQGDPWAVLGVTLTSGPTVQVGTTSAGVRSVFGDYRGYLSGTGYGVHAEGPSAMATLASEVGVQAQRNTGAVSGSLASSTYGAQGMFGGGSDFFRGQLGTADAGGFFESYPGVKAHLAQVDRAAFFEGPFANLTVATDIEALAAANTFSGTSAVLAHRGFALSVDGNEQIGAIVRSLQTALRASTVSIDPTRAAVEAWGNGSEPLPGPVRGAALKVNSGAVTAAGPLPVRFSGTVPVPGPWLPIYSCLGGTPLHPHVIGYYTDVPLASDLVVPGPINEGSMVMATVETATPPMGNTSFYVQVHSKVRGSCVVRVTRMGNAGACEPPVEPTFVHYVVINPDNSM